MIDSLICNQNDKLHVILTILFLQCRRGEIAWCSQQTSNVHACTKHSSLQYLHVPTINTLFALEQPFMARRVRLSPKAWSSIYNYPCWSFLIYGCRSSEGEFQHCICSHSCVNNMDNCCHSNTPQYWDIICWLLGNTRDSVDWVTGESLHHTVAEIHLTATYMHKCSLGIHIIATLAPGISGVARVE